MRDKFHIDAELVLPSTAARLERGLRLGESLFERVPVHVIVSTDFIKSDRHRDEFLRTAPELVIVDEAHTCADASAGRGGRHQRAELVRRARRRRRPATCCSSPRRRTPATRTPSARCSATSTATSSTLPERPFGRGATARAASASPATSSSGAAATSALSRRRHAVPGTRLASDETYALTPPYEAFFDRVLAYARETVTDPDRQRPAPARPLVVGARRSCARSARARPPPPRRCASGAGPPRPPTRTEADAIGRRTVLDHRRRERRRHGRRARAPTPSEPEPARRDTTPLRASCGWPARPTRSPAANDAKLARGIALVKELVADGYAPDRLLPLHRDRRVRHGRAPHGAAGRRRGRGP